MSGMTALNVPAPEGTGGDWHRTSIFGNPKAKLNLAGESPPAFVNTNPILDAYGIHECSAQLREIGLFVPEDKKVYSANHVRAVLDMVIHAADIGQPINFLQAGDFFDNDVQMALLEKGVTFALTHLTGKRAEYLKSWFAQQSALCRPSG
jgi:hypothetical protein